FYLISYFFFQADDGIRDRNVTGVQTCAHTILQHSVNDHFEQMDAEILTHAAFNLRQYMDSNSIVDTSNTKKKPLSQQTLALQNRSEERRVGKERRYFMLQYQQKKNRMLLQYSR